MLALCEKLGAGCVWTVNQYGIGNGRSLGCSNHLLTKRGTKDTNQNFSLNKAPKNTTSYVVHFDRQAIHNLFLYTDYN